MPYHEERVDFLCVKGTSKAIEHGSKRLGVFYGLSAALALICNKRIVSGYGLCIAGA